MENSLKTNLYTEKLFHKLARVISQYRYVILGSIIIGLLAYTYAFTNKLPNHDDLRSLFTKGATVSSGRWGLKLLSYIFPNVSMPWIFGVISLVLITVGNCLIVHIFRIKSPVLQFLLGGIIISFPSQIGTFAYMFTACAYAVSFCLSVVSAFFLCTGKRNYAAASACMIFSLSIYQAYLSITVSILILFLIYRILTEEKNTKMLFFDGLRFVLFLIASLGLYWLATKALWAFSGTGIGSYAKNAFSFSFPFIIEGVRNAYLYFIKILFSRFGRLVPTTLLQIIHWLCIFLAGIEFLLYLLQNKDRKRSALLLFLLAILPLGINCIFLFVAAYSVHTLTLTSFTAIYILLVILIDHGQYRKIKAQFINKCRTIFWDCIVLGMAVIITCNVYTANKAYLNLQLTYENTYSFSTSVIAQLQSTPGYTADSKIAIIGTYNKPDFYNTYFSDLSGLMGVSGISPTIYSNVDFFKYYIGSDLKWASAEECDAITQSSEFADMQSYPSYGFIKQIDDIFVIKLSE